MTSTGSDLRNRIQQKRETVNQQIDETMIPLESPVPAIGTPGSESGGRKRAYGFGLRPGRESAGRATEPYRLRASPRLYTNLVGTLPGATRPSPSSPGSGSTTSPPHRNSRRPGDEETTARPRPERVAVRRTGPVVELQEVTFSGQRSTGLIDDMRIAVIPSRHHGADAGGCAPAG